MNDIEYICDRIILINKGEKLYDGEKQQFKAEYGGGDLIIADFADNNCTIDHPHLKVIKTEGNRKTILFHTKDISVGAAVTWLTRNFIVVDLQVKVPDIEEIVRKIYEGK